MGSPVRCWPGLDTAAADGIDRRVGELEWAGSGTGGCDQPCAGRPPAAAATGHLATRCRRRGWGAVAGRGGRLVLARVGCAGCRPAAAGGSARGFLRAAAAGGQQPGAGRGRRGHRSHRGGDRPSRRRRPLGPCRSGGRGCRGRLASGLPGRWLCRGLGRVPGAPRQHRGGPAGCRHRRRGLRRRPGRVAAHQAGRNPLHPRPGRARRSATTAAAARAVRRRAH